MAWKRELTLAALNASSENTMVAHLGIIYTRLEEGLLEAEMPVDARTHQPFGLLHGGASAALAETLLGREKVYRLKEGGMGSEDFASYTYELPCAYLLLGAGSPQEDPRYGQPMHNPKVVFNEDVLPLGTALLTAGAMHRLER